MLSCQGEQGGGDVFAYTVCITASGEHPCDALLVEIVLINMVCADGGGTDELDAAAFE